jgi:hypothetical protein
MTRTEFRKQFVILFNKYMKMGYDSTHARYLAYYQLR